MKLKQSVPVFFWLKTLGFHIINDIQCDEDIDFALNKSRITCKSLGKG